MYFLVGFFLALIGSGIMGKIVNNNWAIFDKYEDEDDKKISVILTMALSAIFLLLGWPIAAPVFLFAIIIFYLWKSMFHKKEEEAQKSD